MRNRFLIIILIFFSLIFILSQTNCKNRTNQSSGEVMALTMPHLTLSRLQVDPHNPRHFADTTGNPVLLIGDSPQNLPQKLTIPQMRIYFADCKSKGINLCWVCIDGQPTDKAEEPAPLDRKGNPEFFPGGTPVNWDLSRTNQAYFSQTIDSILLIAENYGIYINLMPMSQCYWSPANITANTPQNCFNYGATLGKRYKNQRNLLWIFGNDNIDTSRQCPIARGILSTGDKHLMSVHAFNPKIWGPDPSNDSRGESGNFFKHLPNSTMGWVTYNSLYSDMEVLNQTHFIYNEYMKKDVMPIIMTEGPYQKLRGYKWQIATNQVERGLNYRVAIGGGFGGAYTYGCDWLQSSNTPWDKYLNLGARPHIRFFSELLKDRPWWDLTPDWKHKFLTATTLKGGLEIENDNYTISAYDTVHGKFGLVYCTDIQTVTIDLSKMSEQVKVQWYDPTTGNFISIPGSPFENRNTHQFTTPSEPHLELDTENTNETSHDWVLVAEAIGFFQPDEKLETKDGITHIREVYKTVDSFNLKIDIFYTGQSFEKENNTAIVFFHGGGWAYGTPSEFFSTCERYAKMGIVTFSVDYRLSIENGVTPNKTISPIESVMDAKSAMRWVRENAEKFHIDRNKIVAAGQSAGGHLALCTAMIDDYNEKSDDLSVSCSPNAILLFSACVNAVEGWCDRLLGDRRTKIWSISPFHNVRKGLPPVIEFHGTDDDQVPKWTVQFFESAMEKEGNYFEQHMYEGRKHYLGGENTKYSRYYDDEILKIADIFLRKYNLLD